jgi:hypothetical protein
VEEPKYTRRILSSTRMKQTSRMEMGGLGQLRRF